jgi:hypothetical protein
MVLTLLFGHVRNSEPIGTFTLYILKLLVFYNRSGHFNGLTFVPCIIRRSRYGQQYALICTTLLFYILAPTCFGSSLPSSGSFLDPSELLEIQIEWMVYHIMCGYVTCVSDSIYWLLHVSAVVCHHQGAS